MIGQLVKRLKSKLSRIGFTLFHASRFHECGSDTFLHSPFRLDGVKFISLGKNSIIQAGGWLYCCPIDKQGGRLTIGSGCIFGYNNHITAVRNVVIEDNVLTANNVYISDNLHSYKDISVPIMHQAVCFKGRVVIGRGSWIGENVSIIGASVGRNSVIGANAVVTCDIPDYSVAVGAPARVIKHYDQNTREWVNGAREGLGAS